MFFSDFKRCLNAYKELKEFLKEQKDFDHFFIENGKIYLFYKKENDYNIEEFPLKDICKELVEDIPW